MKALNEKNGDPLLTELLCRQSVDSEDARVGYQVAVSLWLYEGNLIWSRFNVMLIVHSLVVAGIVQALLAQQSVSTIVAIGLSVFGFVMCVIWYGLIARGFDYQDYYVKTARELEEHHLAPTVQTTVNGMHVNRGSRWYQRGRHQIALVIWLFGVLYVLIGVWKFATL